MRRVERPDGTHYFVIDPDAAMAVSLMGDGPDRMQLSDEEFEELVSDLRELREEEAAAEQEGDGTD